MFYTVYKTTNLTNGKFYIGTHKTKDPNDVYLGSGVVLHAAIKKYGVASFKKEVLFIFDNPEAMFAKEAEIVTAEFLAENNTYNLKLGGYGGWDHIHSNPELNNDRSRKAVDAARRALLEKHGVQSSFQLPEARAKIAESMREQYRSGERTPSVSFKGMSHTQETKEKMSAAKRGKGVGSNNSQFGTIWINNGAEARKIKAADPIPDGWKRGMKY